MEETRLLVERILNGDKKAFEQLVRQNQRLVGQMVARMVPNPKDHEDLCQDVFMRVYENLSGFRFNAKLSTWIAQIAYNRCVNYLQKKRVPVFGDRDLEMTGEPGEDNYSDLQPGPEDVAEERDLSQRVRAEIGNLPPAQRTVITLYHLQDMSYEEIGDIMKLPSGTVKSHLFRARRKLKELLMARYELEEIWS
jgi:RNA polymerase sigma-70 factor (ECF subfamily)